MLRYTYHASDENGVIVTGEIDAPSVSDAVIELEKQRLSVQSIEWVRPEKVAAEKEIEVFHAEIRRLLDGRTLWLPALESMEGELSKTDLHRDFRHLVAHLRSIETVEQFLGSRDALQFLPSFTRCLQSNRKEERLTEWMAMVMAKSETRVRRRKLFAYPIAILLPSSVFLLLFLILVTPTFRLLFLEMEIKVPGPTQLVFWVSDQVTTRAIRSAAKLSIIGLLTFAFIRFWRNGAWTNRLFTSFVAGNSGNLVAMSALIGMMSELLTLKAPLPLSLSIAGRNCRHYFFQRAAEQAAVDLREGALSLTQSEAAKALPPALIHALQIGDSKRPNIALLHELSKIYRERAASRVDWFSVGSPILAIGLVGFLIGFFVIAMFLPMINMITQLSN
ncbi:MAG: type II secretion system F family protein [Pirellulaceae bacterium]|nr:type II secretion system F family protein [Pirellulaceae bacterium]